MNQPFDELPPREDTKDVIAVDDTKAEISSPDAVITERHDHFLVSTREIEKALKEEAEK